MSNITGFHHLGLTVVDLDASSTWYREDFGLQQIMEESVEGGRVIVFRQPDSEVVVGLHAYDASDRSRFDETRTGLDHISFSVKSRQELVEWKERLHDRGTDVSPISDQPWGSVLVFRDPENIQLELWAHPGS